MKRSSNATVVRHLQAAIDPPTACTWSVELMLLSAGHCAEEINTDVMELFSRLQQEGGAYSKYNSSIAFYGLRVVFTPSVQVIMGIHSTLQPFRHTVCCMSTFARQACLLCDALDQHMLNLVAMVFPSLRTVACRGLQRRLSTASWNMHAQPP